MIIVTLSWQIPVDIMTGVTDEQCKQMAQNLEFKESALAEVPSTLSIISEY